MNMRIAGSLCSLLLLGMFPAMSAATQETSRDLVLHYTFDQPMDGQIPNAIGEKHSGKLKQATLVQESKSGQSLLVRKNQLKSGYVETANHDDFNSERITVAAWIKLEQTRNNGSIVCKHDWRDGAARGFVLRCYSGDQLNFTVGAGGWLAAVGKTKLNANQWIHVAGAFDATNIRVYVNGRLDGVKKVEAPYKPSAYPLRIGHAAFSLDVHRKFDGKIDDVMIWKRALTGADVRAVYQKQKDARPGPLVDADIAALIRQLGANDFKVRTQAQKQLLDYRSEVLPLLEPYLKKKSDFEIISRVKQIQAVIRNDRWE